MTEDHKKNGKLNNFLLSIFIEEMENPDPDATEENMVPDPVRLDPVTDPVNRMPN